MTVLFIGLVIAVVGVVVLVQGIQGKQPALRSLGGVVLVLGLLTSFASRTVVVVPAGHVGVVFNVFGGVQEREFREGFHLVVPFLQQVTLYDVRQQEITLARETGDQITARSSEGLEITVDATILYQVAAAEAARLHQDIGPSYVDVRLRPQVRSQVRDSIAQFAAAELISTQRSEVGTIIEDRLANELAKDNINVLTVLLRDVRIPEAITQAIEEKQAAEQQVQVEQNRKQQAEIAAQRRVVEAQGERDAAIARAEGEARALSLRGQAIRENPEIIQLEVAQKLAPGVQTILLPSDGNFLLDLRNLTSTGTGAAPTP